jgi:hypothetical protein
MTKTVSSLEEMENLFSNTLPIEQLIFLELRDCDNTAGTPMYYEKVETLIRTVNSHHKAKDDKVFQKEMKESIEEIPDPKILLHNSRCATRNKKKVTTVQKINYKKQHTAALNFLARRNITFKEERTAVL